MIKINKDLDAIPESLKPPTPDFFPPPATAPRSSRTTHQRRLEIINAGNYIDRLTYNDRYKTVDIKTALKSIYHNKCAFCEQRVEMKHIEHFRPKKGGYYWLAYSWDNLLIACPMCNIHKGDHFEIKGRKATFRNTVRNIQNIHKSSRALDDFEHPKLINPEVIDPYKKIRFNQVGEIDSDDEDFSYTIDTCKLSRPELCDLRRKIIDDFRRDITSIFTETKIEDQKTEISTITKQFIRRLKDTSESFIAYRRFTIENGWLTNIVQSLN